MNPFTNARQSSTGRSDVTICRREPGAVPTVHHPLQSNCGRGTAGVLVCVALGVGVAVSDIPDVGVCVGVGDVSGGVAGVSVEVGVGDMAGGVSVVGVGVAVLVVKGVAVGVCVDESVDVIVGVRL